MKLYQLLKIDPERIQRSSNIKVELENSSILVEERKGFFNRLWGRLRGKPNVVNNLLKFSCTNVSNDHKYTVYFKIQPQNNYSKLLSSKVEIFCSCNDFKYRSAYRLNKENNLFRVPAIEKYLGIALTVKPTQVQTTPVCKHIYAVSGWLSKNLKELDLSYE